MMTEAELDAFFENHWEPHPRMESFFEAMRERAKRQEAYDHAKASAKLEGLKLPPAADEIMQQYVDGLITWEERQARMLALVMPQNQTQVWLSGVVQNMQKMHDDPSYEAEIVRKRTGLLP